MWLAWERRGKFIGFRWGKPEGKRTLGRRKTENWLGWGWSGMCWLRIGTCGGLL
jgi:hypothetical protein